MSPFRRLAEQIVARDAGFVALAGITLMIAFSFEPPTAFKSGGTVALVFAVGQILRASRLTDDGVDRVEAWRFREASRRQRPPLGARSFRGTAPARGEDCLGGRDRLLQHCAAGGRGGLGFSVKFPWRN